MGFKSKAQEVKKIFPLIINNIKRSKIWKFFNVPNILTFARVVLIFPFVMNVLNDKYLKACKILILSGITDVLDGFFARLLKQETLFGTVFDPLVDKMTILSIMICLGIKLQSIIPFVAILISKEIVMLMAGTFMISKYKCIIKSKWYGKIGTAFFYFSVIVIVGMKYLWNIENEFTVNVLMWATSLLMAFALVKYTIEFVKVISARKKHN